MESISLRLQKLEKMFEKSEKSRIFYQNKFWYIKKKIAKLLKELQKANKKVIQSSLQERLSNIFNEDQINLLTRQYKKIPQWCNKTLVNAYKLRFTCGSAGHTELLRQKFPLPSIRVLTRKLENFHFTAGEPLMDVFKFLQIKVDEFKHDIFKDCMVVLDEMSITPGNFYDTSLNRFIGNVTLFEHNTSVIATKAMVIMLAGLGARWKQVVQYDFTGDSVNGSCLKPLIDKIILLSEEIGLRVHAVVSDQGSSNQAMWKAYGINASRYSIIQNYCSHPVDPSRRLYFIADPPHAFKNLRTSFLTNNFFAFDDSFANKYGLPVSKAQSSHIRSVVDEDKENLLKLAPRLKEQYLNMNNHYQKMRVGNACKVMSEQVSSGLEFLASDNPTDSKISTAFFIDFCARWFNAMCGRYITMALSLKDENKFNEQIAFFEEAIQFFRTLRVGDGNSRWKPFQTAILVSTQSVIDLSKYLLSNRFTFFLPARLSQDCLENLFSVVRLTNVIPNALQFKNNLKLISISQFMKEVQSGNYENDDRQFLSEFLDILLKNRSVTSHYTTADISLSTNIKEDQIFLNRTEMNILYYVSGYIISSIKKNEKVCDYCINFTKSPTVLYRDYNLLTRIKENKQKPFFYETIETFQFFIQMERIFRLYYAQLSSVNINLKAFFLTKFGEIQISLPDCHNLKNKIINRFYIFRVRNSYGKKMLNKKVYGSKSVAMHQIT